MDEKELAQQVYNNVKTGLWRQYRWPVLIFVLLFLIAISVTGYFAWQHFHQPQPVTGESQQQAETPAGVELAAKNAHIYMLQSQLSEAARQIAELKNKPPDTVVKTVPVEVPKVIEIEREKRGADFAIVTDPQQLEKQVNLKEIEKLPADTAISLNQYNVFAYKKIIRGINIYPGLKIKVNEVTADVSKRITKDGRYLGVTGGYDFEHEKAKLGLRYSF